MKISHIAVDARMIDSSGIGRVIENILQRMIPARPAWRFSLIGEEAHLRDRAFAQAANVAVVPCACPIYTIREQLVLPRLVPQDADVLWVPHYNIPVFYRGRLVVTVHDLAHLALPQYRKSPLKRAYASLLFRAVCQKADAVACVSRFTMAELRRFVPGVNPAKLHLVYNGVDEAWSRIPSGPPIHARPYLLYVGNIKPHKNLHFLVRAFQRIADRVPYDLILVGKRDGFLTGDDGIGALVRGWEDRIFFTGWVADDALRQYVAQAAAMVFPSLYEGFGLPPLEALAAGTPVLASDIPVLHEVCGNDVAYFNPRKEENLAAAICRMADDADGRKIMKNTKFFWGETTSQMLALIGRTAALP